MKHQRPARGGLIRIVGETEDGKTVVAGVYRFYETVGLPLDVILSELNQRNALPCWNTLVDEMKTAGWGERKIRGTLDAAIAAVYPREFCAVVMERVDIKP